MHFSGRPQQHIECLCEYQAAIIQACSMHATARSIDRKTTLGQWLQKGSRETRQMLTHLHHVQVWMWVTAIVYLVWRWHWRRERRANAQLAQREEEQQAQYDEEWEQFAEGYGKQRAVVSSAPAGTVAGRRS